MNARPHLAQIFSAACDYFSVTRETFQSAHRSNAIVWQRQIAMAIMREYGYPCTVVGRVFNRDSGTALHAQRVVSNRVETNAEDRRTYEGFARVVSELKPEPYAHTALTPDERESIINEAVSRMLETLKGRLAA